MTLTPDDVFKVADALAARGENPTLAAVRRELKRGSYTTISEAMQAWRARRRAVEASLVTPLPEDLRGDVLAWVQRVWQLAQARADARLQAERDTLHQDRAQMVAESSEAAQIADKLSAELQRISAEQEKEHAQRLAAEQQVAELHSQVVRLETEVKAAREAQQQAERHADQLGRLLEQLGNQLADRRQAEAVPANGRQPNVSPPRSEGENGATS